VHRHEVPRKVLHVSIGFLTLWFYVSGLQTSDITPWLLGLLIPIATTDYLRHTFPSFNRFYVRVLGAFMRETEYDGWNGVIWYLLGAWLVLGFFPKDVGVMGVLLLSWCDTAASTVGRAYGRYTPRIRRGKSLAGSLAAFAVGVFTAMYYWGYLAPRYNPTVGTPEWPFMFTGTLSLPSPLTNALGLKDASVSGNAALGIMSLWSGLVASASEVVDIYGWDDNLTIPVLSGIGIWAFLKVFG
jgi:diacylglycerol kinase (CTP)